MKVIHKSDRIGIYEVVGSQGDKYLVSDIGKSWFCSCAIKYKRSYKHECYHIKEIKNAKERTYQYGRRTG